MRVPADGRVGYCGEKPGVPHTPGFVGAGNTCGSAALTQSTVNMMAWLITPCWSSCSRRVPAKGDVPFEVCGCGVSPQSCAVPKPVATDLYVKPVRGHAVACVSPHPDATGIPFPVCGPQHAYAPKS